MGVPNLREALELAASTKAFAVNRHGGMVLVTYLYHDRQIFAAHPLARELRGAVWEEESGELLSRPFHKFYNLGEPLAPRLEGPMAGEGALVAPKVDGFLVQAFLREGRVVKASRQSLTMGLIRPLVEDLWTQAHDALVRQVSEALGSSTLLFELVHPKAVILQKGQTPGLHLLAARRLADGQYVVPMSPWAKEALGGGERDLEEAAGPLPPGILAARWHLPEEVFGEDPTWEEALKAVRAHALREKGWESLEGAVALLEGGELVKLKTPWAFWVAALLMDFARTVLEAIADDRADDLGALLKDTRPDLHALVEAVAEEVGRQVRGGAALGEAWRGKPRKDFWAEVQRAFPEAHEVLAQRAAVLAYEGSSPEEIWLDARQALRRRPTQERLEGWLQKTHGAALAGLRNREVLAELRG